MDLTSPSALIPAISIALLLFGYGMRARRWAPYCMLAGAFGLLGVLLYRVSVAIA
ncbi:hypothetical protein HBH1_04187 [Herbaspirillum sp. BH-1]|uniref:Uncharacterized protein n=1 Tax=Herbaspirillum frisingense TaxID=92645 RepID=A0ABU1P7I3_9BURK|nr:MULTISPECIES: hypothetical protein [Herbaspirillum]MDR6581871.1 hypothetical protein [Herbaspirillum frisingense]PLY57495.1 hypothetical protein HBH1_04187 [Herbaspirillum sp. BH-1]QNB07082.1 hypothetical protein G5S34_10070 [Herbaspirillum frisingense]UIN23218.1 hypothetical protein LAZ82_08995 [Herbaspirillum frisingense]HZG21113.1 hypothetical protein [Herbaspirillum sp.]